MRHVRQMSAPSVYFAGAPEQTSFWRYPWGPPPLRYAWLRLFGDACGLQVRGGSDERMAHVVLLGCPPLPPPDADETQSIREETPDPMDRNDERDRGGGVGFGWEFGGWKGEGTGTNAVSPKGNGKVCAAVCDLRRTNRFDCPVAQRHAMATRFGDGRRLCSTRVPLPSPAVLADPHSTGDAPDGWRTVASEGTGKPKRLTNSGRGSYGAGGCAPPARAHTLRIAMSALHSARHALWALRRAPPGHQDGSGQVATGWGATGRAAALIVGGDGGVRGVVDAVRCPGQSDGKGQGRGNHARA